jgi:nicotinamidase-related amidase
MGRHGRRASVEIDFEADAAVAGERRVGKGEMVRRRADGALVVGRQQRARETSTMTTSAMPEPPGDSALMLIDFQADFLADDGRMPVARAHVAPMIAAAADAVELFKRRGRPVVAIGNEFRRSDIVMNFFRRYASIEGSTGARWDDRVPLDGAKYFPKWGSSAFGNPELEPWLRANGVGALVIGGLMARACVTATTKAAIERGFRVMLIEPAIACVSDRSRERALARLERKGALPFA